MSRKAIAILRLLALVGLLAYLIFAATLPDRQAEQTCQQIHIHIADSTRHQYLSTGDVLEQLRRSGQTVVGQPRAAISLSEAEQTLRGLEVVNDAQCYFDTRGTLNVQIRQREPKLRVITAGGNFFVDADRRVMRATSRTATDVLVITGAVSEQMAQNELFDFVLWLEEHSFWYAQIEQINVTPRREIELIPRVGSHLIQLGTLDHFDQKLHKLQVFYQEGLAKIGWQPYREIDLRYHGQVVARK